MEMKRSKAKILRTGEVCRVLNTTPYGKVRISVYREGKEVELIMPRKEVAYL